VTVTAATNRPPSVSLTAPAANSTFTAPATVNLAATAADSDGTIGQVDFYAGSSFIGTATASPYGYSWTSVPAGSYQLTAVARDNGGATTTSAAVAITITSATPLPTQVLFTPSVDDGLVDSYTVAFFAAGANPDTGPAASSQNVGKPPVVNGRMTVDVSAVVQSLIPGTYFATVSSNAAAGTSRSAPSADFVR
jgi:hypothetical protein